MRPEVFLAILIVGLGLGALVGYATRPALMGTPLPLSILMSTAEADASLKALYQSHFAMWVGIGGIASAAAMGVGTYFSHRLS